jgi:UDP-2,4-diacetamido-2,4,6-trideoxy-beta-L-altropyranose hydrolase
MHRIVIRVDASVEMGVGHLTRCITLANALAANGARVCFMMRDRAAAFAGLIEAGGHRLRLLSAPEFGHHAADMAPLAHAHWLPLSWQQDAAQTSEAMAELGPVDWLIVDHYALDARWEQRLRQPGLRVLAVDDLADRRHDCDILLDQNLVQRMDIRYQSLVPGTCRLLLGPRYALLRPEFAELRRSRAERNGPVKRILIGFGGTDPSNETAKALAAVRCVAVDGLVVDVVIGGANPNAEQVSRVCEQMADARLYCGADNMAELMARADLAIGAGGVMSWERCCLGLPTIAVAIAENQIGALTALAAAGAVDYLGSDVDVSQRQLAHSLDAMMRDSGRTRVMSEIALALVDGVGAGRIREAMAAAEHIAGAG